MEFFDLEFDLDLDQDLAVLQKKKPCLKPDYQCYKFKKKKRKCCMHCETSGVEPLDE